MFVLEFLAFGAWGFWLLLVGSSVLMSELLDNDAPGWATILAVVTMAVLAVFGGVNPITWIMAHPWDTVLVLAGYFAAGAAWSLVKWYSYLLKIRRRMEAIRKEHPDWANQDVTRLLRNSGIGGTFPPEVSDHKSRVIGWMALWPASMLWTVINDPVRRACEEIYNRLGGVYQAISNRVFRDFQ